MFKQNCYMVKSKSILIPFFSLPRIGWGFFCSKLYFKTFETIPVYIIFLKIESCKLKFS